MIVAESSGPKRGFGRRGCSSTAHRSARTTYVEYEQTIESASQRQSSLETVDQKISQLNGCSRAPKNQITPMSAPSTTTVPMIFDLSLIALSFSLDSIPVAIR